MKKLIFISVILLSFALTGIRAQLPALSTYSLETDTIAASATVYLTLDKVYKKEYIAISPYALNISGTTGVTYTLQEKIDTYWTPLTTSNCTELSAANDSITLLTATSGRWVIISYGNEYRIKCTADGTTQSSIVGAAIEVKR